MSGKRNDLIFHVTGGQQGVVIGSLFSIRTGEKVESTDNQEGKFLSKSTIWR